MREKSSTHLLSKPESVHRKIDKELSSPTVPCIIVYDINRQAVELVFKRCEVPHTALQLIAFCLPYQANLTRLTFHWVQLRAATLYEIANFLPNSFITDVCLDDCPLREANYYTLLENTSSLRNLSLDRCSLGDPGCEKLAMCLVHPLPASSKLVTLSLAINCIGDSGARALAVVLRSNRTLLHLNLSGNYVSDIGAEYILSSLTEFEMTFEEIVKTRKRRIIYMEKRRKVYDKFYAQLLESSTQQATLQTQYDSKTTKKKPELRGRASPSVMIKASTSSRTGRPMALGIDAVASKAELMTNESMGPWLEPFSAAETIPSDDNTRIFSRGNRILCSLNLSYNLIGYFTAVKLVQVLRYQESVREENLQGMDELTGLLRVVVEGCPMPSNCTEMEEIHAMLDRFVLTKIAKNRYRHSVRSPKTKKH